MGQRVLLFMFTYLGQELVYIIVWHVRIIALLVKANNTLWCLNNGLIVPYNVESNFSQAICWPWNLLDIMYMFFYVCILIRSSSLRIHHCDFFIWLMVFNIIVLYSRNYIQCLFIINHKLHTSYLKYHTFPYSFNTQRIPLAFATKFAYATTYIRNCFKIVHKPKIIDWMWKKGAKVNWNVKAKNYNWQ